MSTANTRMVLCPSVEPFLASSGELFLLPTSDLPQKVVPAPWGRWVWEEIRSDTGASTAPPAAGSTTPDAGDAQVVEAAIDELARIGYVRPHAAVAHDPGLARYDRQLRYLAQCGLDAAAAQRRLGGSSVLVIGLGGGGCAVSDTLVRMGIGTLVGVDFDVVEDANIPRQSLYRSCDVGRFKISAAARALRACGSDTDVRVEEQRIESAAQVVDLVERHRPDLMVACADTPPLSFKRWVDAACMATGVPAVMGGTRPPFAYVGPTIAPGRSVCFECFSGLGRAGAGEDETALLAELEAWRDTGVFEVPAIGFCDQAAASLMVSEIVALLVGTHEPVTLGRERAIDTRSMDATWIEPAFDGCDRCREWAMGRLGKAA